MNELVAEMIWEGFSERLKHIALMRKGRKLFLLLYGIEKWSTYLEKESFTTQTGILDRRQIYPYSSIQYIPAQIPEEVWEMIQAHIALHNL